MADLKICRVCLRTKCKMFNYDRFYLKSFYEEIMAVKVDDKDGLPHYFCYECAMLIHKFHKFKEKCYSGQKALTEIGWRGSLTYKAVNEIDRGLRKLKSNLDILTVNKRVKTFTIDEKEEDDDEDSESDNEPLQKLSKLSTVNLTIDDEEPIDLNKTNLSSSTKFISDDETITDRDDHFVAVNDPELDDDVKPLESIDTDASEVKNEDDIVLLNDIEEDSKVSDVELKVEKKVTKPKPKKEKVIKKMRNVRRRVVNKVNNARKENEKTKEPEQPGSRVKKTHKYNRFHKDSNLEDFVLRQPHPSYLKKRTRFLDESNWKRYNLSEEDAMKEFLNRAQDKKYLAAPYQCTDCYKPFSKEDILKRHKQLRHDQSIGELDCRFCHMRFRLDCQLRKHMRNHFARFECLRCTLVCTLENTALLHEEYHNGVIKKCAHCGDEFKHSSTYYTHLRTHRSEYLCTLCGASFVSPLGLTMHKKIKHINNEVEKSEDDDEPVNTYCQRCDIRFETRKAYEEHLFHSAMHTEGVEDEVIGDASIPRKVLGKKWQAQITQDLNKKDGVPSPPPIPNVKKRLGRKKNRTHRKPTTCHQCGEHFDTQAACMKHHLSMHPRTSFCPPTERHICEICGASLAPGSVATHINMHTRAKVHTCETCGRAFHSSVGLKRHMVTHTGEKPFACTLCDKRFTQSNSMKLHYKTFHLKQPYPKRNRRKNKDDLMDCKTSEDESNTSLALIRRPHEDVHYLTLS